MPAAVFACRERDTQVDEHRESEIRQPEKVWRLRGQPEAVRTPWPVVRSNTPLDIAVDPQFNATQSIAHKGCQSLAGTDQEFAVRLWRRLECGTQTRLPDLP